MSYEGDIKLGRKLNFHFTTRNTTPVPTKLDGSPVISVYKDDGTSKITTGISLSVDFDSKTGLNRLSVDTGAHSFYVKKTDYMLVITTGTVGGNSVIGEVVGTFSIENRHIKAISRGGRYG